MPHEGNYTFAGILGDEARDRYNEHRSGVPALGGGADLQDAPVRRTSAVHAQCVGHVGAHLRLKHRGAVKTITGELLAALAASATEYRGRLQFKNLVPGSLLITEAGALADVEDDGNGNLTEVGTGTARGTVNYVTGTIDLTWGAAATEPVSIDYQHNDSEDFASAGQTTIFTGATAPAGAYPEALQLGFGRVVPGSVSITDGVETFVDDGKGNMIETTGGIASVEGTIDYATGLVTLTGGTGTLADPTTATFTFNPFAARLVAGGSARLFDLFSQIPEMTNEPWADGVNGEDRIVLWGESLEADEQSAVIAQWVHYSDEPYRVENASDVQPGGHDNDPNVLQP